MTAARSVPPMAGPVADVPDAQCSVCAAPFVSGTGHPTLALCAACAHPLTLAHLRLLVALGGLGQNPRTGRHYVAGSFGTGVTTTQLRTLRLLAVRGHIALGATSFGPEYVAVHLRPTAVAGLTRWCADLDAKAGK